MELVCGFTLIVIQKMSTTVVVSFGRRLASLKQFQSVYIRQVGGGGKGKRPSRLWRLVKWTAGGAALATGSYYAWKFVKKATRPRYEGESKKKLVILGSG